MVQEEAIDINLARRNRQPRQDFKDRAVVLQNLSDQFFLLITF